MQFDAVRKNSQLRKLDFRAKLGILFSVGAVACIWDSPSLQLGLTLATALACLFGGVRARTLLGLFKVLLPFAILLLLTHGFFNVEHVKQLTGRRELTRLFTIPAAWPVIGGGGMSREGLLYGVSAALKTLTLSFLVPLTVFTTDVNNIVVGLVRARVPYKVAFIFSATLRFFPLLFSEVRSILDAQRMRGLPLERMGVIRRVSVYAKVAVPLILGAMVKSQQLEVVLQSKAFSGKPERTYLTESQLGHAEYLVLFGSAFFVVAALSLYLGLGVGRFS